MCVIDSSPKTQPGYFPKASGFFAQEKKLDSRRVRSKPSDSLTLCLSVFYLMADKESSSSVVVPAKAEEKKKSWADVAEEESETELKKLEELTVSDDSKGPDASLLEDPDDSQIKAVGLLFIKYRVF
jgi:hypothetical protein